MNFALRLKELREKKGISQAQLAAALSIGIGSIGMWASTDRIPNSSKLIKIAEFFDTNCDYLLCRTNYSGTISNSAAPAISAEEREILALYSNLDHMGKKYVRQTLEILNGGATSVDLKKKNS